MDTASKSGVTIVLDNVKKLNPKLNAFVAMNDQVLEKAQKLDKLSDKKGDLFGIPLGIKDIFCTKGISSAASSQILKDFIPPYSATCVEDLEKNGALVLGKLIFIIPPKFDLVILLDSLDLNEKLNAF